MRPFPRSNGASWNLTRPTIEFRPGRCYKMGPLKRRTGKSTTWVAALVALFLVFVLPACWSGAMQRAWAERGQAPSSSNTNEEREERDHCEEREAARIAAPPEAAPPRIDEIDPPRAVVHHTHTTVASVAPKQHPSRFSERRLR